MASRESARRFQFLREIASGGFGSVFLAKVMHADGFSRLVAIKLLHRRWSENKEIAQRMRDEARLLGWLRHRNIVDVIDLTSIDGRAAVIMEYLEAVDLKSVVQDLSDRGDRIPPYAALEIVSFVSSALDAAYNRPPYEGEKPLRVIHRDIKPSNIMVDESGTVKVLDFGVARGEFENRESHTQELNFGSVEYMPPERLFFEPETDRADVYSLGATLFEFLAGERLGKAKGRGEKHAAFLEDRLSYLAARCPLPNPQSGDLAKFIRDMCAYNADNRPSAESLVLRARQLARQMPGPALAEFAEQVVKPLVAAQSRAPREPNPLTEKVLPEDSTLFGSGEMVDRSGGAVGGGDAPPAPSSGASVLQTSGSSASSSAPALSLATGSAPAEGMVAEVPRDDARWDALRKAALAEMAVSEAPPVLAPSFGPSLATAQALDPALVDGYDDEPTRIGALPSNIAVVAKAPVAEPIPVRTSTSPESTRGKSPGISPMIAAAPPPVDDLSSEEMPFLAPPPGTGGISAPMPRALAVSASRERTVPGGAAASPVEAAAVPSLPEPLPIISAPGGYSGLDPISAEVAVGPAEALDLDASPSAEVPAPPPVDPPPPAAFTFVPEAPPSGLASASMTMVPLDDGDPEGAPTTVLPVSAPPPVETMAPVGTMPPSSATMVPDADFEPAPAPAKPAAASAPAPAAKASVPAVKPAPVKSASARPSSPRPAAPAPGPASANAAPARPARPPEPRSVTEDPPPEDPKSSSMMLILGGAAVVGVLGGLLIAAMVLGYTWYTAREAPSAPPVASAPAAAPATAPAVAPAPAAGPDDVTFVSAAADTLKVTASCGGKDTTGAGSVVVAGPVSGPCVVKLVKKDRSRVIAEVASPSAGTYTCFAGDAKACVH